MSEDCLNIVAEYFCGSCIAMRDLILRVNRNDARTEAFKDILQVRRQVFFVFETFLQLLVCLHMEGIF